MLIKDSLLLLLFTSLTFGLAAQAVYKTPYGERYHLASCKMVENVSEKLNSRAEIRNLTPCKRCQPPNAAALVFGVSSGDKSVGEAHSVQCKGLTQANSRCKHQTRLANGYCFQHTSQDVATNTRSQAAVPRPAKATTAPISIAPRSSSSANSSACGAKTASGSPCKRMVKGGGRCYQH